MLKVTKNPYKGKKGGGVKIYHLASNKGYDFDLKRDRVALHAVIPSSYMNVEGDIISYVTSKKITKEGNEKDIHGKIIFIKGILKVEPNRRDLMKFLDECPWNKSNEHRDPRKRILFYEYIESEEKEAAYEVMIQSHDVMKRIFALNGELLKDVARGFGIKADQEEKYIQTDLIAISENNPRFEEFMDSPEIKIVTLIAKSRELKLIKSHRKLWMWNSESGGNANTICSVPTGKNKQDHLVDFLMSEDGAEVRKELMKSTSIINEKKTEEIKEPTEEAVEIEN